MGIRITKLSQHQGSSAWLGGSVMLFTHHGSAYPFRRRIRLPAALSEREPRGALRQYVGGYAEDVMTAWLITIPASAAVAALFY